MLMILALLLINWTVDLLISESQQDIHYITLFIAIVAQLK